MSNIRPFGTAPSGEPVFLIELNNDKLSKLNPFRCSYVSLPEGIVRYKKVWNAFQISEILSIYEPIDADLCYLVH